MGNETQFIEAELMKIINSKETELDNALLGSKDTLATNLASWIASFPSISDYLYSFLFDKLQLPYQDYTLERKVGSGDKDVEDSRATYLVSKRARKKSFCEYYYDEKVINPRLMKMLGTKDTNNDLHYEQVTKKWRSRTKIPGYQIQARRSDYFDTTQRILIYLAIALKLTYDEVVQILKKCLLRNNLVPQNAEEVIWQFCLINRNEQHTPADTYRQMCKYLNYYHSDQFDSDFVSLEKRKKTYWEYAERMASEVAVVSTYYLTDKATNLKTENGLFLYLWKLKFTEYDITVNKLVNSGKVGKDFREKTIEEVFAVVHSKSENVRIKRKTLQSVYREALSRFPHKLTGEQTDGLLYKDIFQEILRDQLVKKQVAFDELGRPTKESYDNYFWKSYSERTYTSWDGVMEMVYAFEKEWNMNRIRRVDQSILTESEKKEDDLDEVSTKKAFQILYEQKRGAVPKYMPKPIAEPTDEDLTILILFLRKNREYAFLNNQERLLPLSVLKKVFYGVPDLRVNSVRERIKGYESITRNELLTVLFIDFWENYDSNYEGEEDTPSLRLTRFTEEIDGALMDCGMQLFYQRPPYEVFMVLAAKYNSPLSYFYASWETVLREGNCDTSRPS